MECSVWIIRERERWNKILKVMENLYQTQIVIALILPPDITFKDNWQAHADVRNFLLRFAVLRQHTTIHNSIRKIFLSLTPCLARCSIPISYLHANSNQFEFHIISLSVVISDGRWIEILWKCRQGRNDTWRWHTFEWIWRNIWDV